MISLDPKYGKIPNDCSDNVEPSGSGNCCWFGECKMLGWNWKWTVEIWNWHGHGTDTQTCLIWILNLIIINFKLCINNNCWVLTPGWDCGHLNDICKIKIQEQYFHINKTTNWMYAQPWAEKILNREMFTNHNGDRVKVKHTLGQQFSLKLGKTFGQIQENWCTHMNTHNASLDWTGVGDKRLATQLLTKRTLVWARLGTHKMTAKNDSPIRSDSYTNDKRQWILELDQHF